MVADLAGPNDANEPGGWTAVQHARSHYDDEFPIHRFYAGRAIDPRLNYFI